jgi:GAF domain-containing protein
MADQETERIKAVKRFEKFDFALNKGIQGILKIAAEVYESPAAFITLIAEHEQWFKVRHGFEILNMPRETSFCTHTIMRHEPMVVSDALDDERFVNSPFVRQIPNIRFYAGAALSDYEGQNIGTLCIMDVHPKSVPEEKKKLLVMLAKQAIHLMELDMSYQATSERTQQVEQQNMAFREIALAQSDDLDESLVNMTNVLNIINGSTGTPPEVIQILEDAANTLDGRIKKLKKSTEDAKKIYLPG